MTRTRSISMIFSTFWAAAGRKDTSESLEAAARASKTSVGTIISVVVPLCSHRTILNISLGTGWYVLLREDVCNVRLKD